MDSNYIEHHGIFGMHWGVRKNSGESGSSTSSSVESHESNDSSNTGKSHESNDSSNTGKSHGSNDSDTTRNSVKRESTKSSETSIKKTASNMSDDELRTVVNRINLERQYKDLTTPKESKYSLSGAAKDIVFNSAKNVATTYCTKYMTSGIEYLLKKK